MKVKDILELGLTNDNTNIVIRNSEFKILAIGNWYQDDILDYSDHEAECFTWQDDNRIFIDITD